MESSGDEQIELQRARNLIFRLVLVTALVCALSAPTLIQTATAQSGTWQQVWPTDGSENPPAIRGLFRGPDGVLWFDAGGKIYRSESFGAAWQEIDAPGTPFAKDDTGLIYSHIGRALHRSSDQGETWDLMAELEPVYDVHGFSIESLSVAPGGLKIAVSSADYLHDFFYFVYISTDGGETWDSFDRPWSRSGYASNTGDLFVDVTGTLIRSQDSGQTWDDVGAFGAGIFVRGFARASNGDLLAAAFDSRNTDNDDIGGLHRSTDEGASWQKLDLDTENGSAVDLESDETGQVVLLTVDGGIYRTYGGSEVDLLTRLDASSIELTGVTFAADGSVLVGTEEHGLLRSDGPLVTGMAPRSDSPTAEVGLRSPYPNPVRAAASAFVPYTVGTSGSISLALFDVLGRRIAVLEEGIKAAGKHQTSLQAFGLAPGIYFIRLQTVDHLLTTPIFIVE